MPDARTVEWQQQQVGMSPFSATGTYWIVGGVDM